MSRMYQPGTAVVDITAPGGIQALLDFHRRTFGTATLEADNAPPEGQQGAQTGSTEETRPNSQQGQSTEGKNDGEEDLGFPKDTPVADMTIEQREAYWKHQARKHERAWQGRLGQYTPEKVAQIIEENENLRRQTQSEQERAIEDAKKQAREEARAEVLKETLPRLVRAEFKAVAAGRLDKDRLESILDPLDLTKFLTDNGEVDTGKVEKFLGGLVPAGKKRPDMGQGHRPSTESKGVSAGRDLYAQRHKKSEQ